MSHRKLTRKKPRDLSWRICWLHAKPEEFLGRSEKDCPRCQRKTFLIKYMSGETR